MVPFRVGRTVGIWGHYCLYRASTGRGSAKGFSFIFPSSAQNTILVSKGKEDVMLAGGAGLNGERARNPWPPRGFPAALPTLPHLLLCRAEVGEGWKPRHRAQRKQTPFTGFLATPTPPCPAWRDALAPGSGRATVAMAAQPLCLPPPQCPRGLRALALRGRRDGVPALPQLQSGPNHKLARSGRGPELCPSVAGPRGRLAHSLPSPLGHSEAWRPHLVSWGRSWSSRAWSRMRELFWFWNLVGPFSHLHKRCAPPHTHTTRLT